MKSTAERERDQRAALAGAIEGHAQEIVSRWLDLIRADVATRHVDLTALQNGIGDYLKGLVGVLRSGEGLEQAASSAWADVARTHALTRVRLGFDVSQLLQEFVLLRRVITLVLRHSDVQSNGGQGERVVDLIEAAMATSVKSYVDSRDYQARRQEAEHVGFITHELRNPLGTATMAASQLGARDLSEHHRARLLEALERSLQRIEALVDQVLFVERTEAVPLESRPVATRLGSVVNDVLENVRQSAVAKGITLTVDLDPELELYVDPELTATALLNLLDNAIRYTDAGAVGLSIEGRPGEVVIHVRDNCPGLSPEELRLVFQPFQRVHSKAGAGMGLAVARRAVEAQGGTVHAESDDEVGCHFWFTLPRTRH